MEKDNPSEAHTVQLTKESLILNCHFDLDKDHLINRSVSHREKLVNQF